MRLRWDGIIARLSYRFNFLAIREVKPPRPKQWTESELRQLRVLAKKKASADTVADSLGRHVGSVKIMARELGVVLSKNVKAKGK